MTSNSQKKAQSRSSLVASARGARRAAAQPAQLVRPASPFLKWAGGKTQLLSAFDEFIPDRFACYLEPFLGGGAMFFHMHSRRPGVKAVVADLNDELINCYTAVRDNVDLLVNLLKEHKNEEEYFYKLRSKDTTTMSKVERASRLIYLNKTCFNGLYRVNRQGQFNVPFGSYKNPRTCDESNLRAVSEALRNVDILNTHFADTLKAARKNDFVYLDPPYQPLSATSNFTSYTSKCFADKDQEELAETVKALDKRGCKFMLSNSDNPFVRSLYREFRIETVFATRAINCRGDRRGKISEVLVMNY